MSRPWIEGVWASRTGEEGCKGGVVLCAFLGRPPQGRGERNPGGECRVEENRAEGGARERGTPLPERVRWERHELLEEDGAGFSKETPQRVMLIAVGFRFRGYGRPSGGKAQRGGGGRRDSAGSISASWECCPFSGGGRGHLKRVFPWQQIEEP